MWSASGKFVDADVGSSIGNVLSLHDEKQRVAKIGAKREKPSNAAPKPKWLIWVEENSIRKFVCRCRSGLGSRWGCNDKSRTLELSNSRTNESKIKGAKAENTETDKVQKVGMVLGVVVVLLWWHRDLLSHGRTGSVTRKAQ